MQYALVSACRSPVGPPQFLCTGGSDFQHSIALSEPPEPLAAFPPCIMASTIVDMHWHGAGARFSTRAPDEQERCQDRRYRNARGFHLLRRPVHHGHVPGPGGHRRHVLKGAGRRPHLLLLRRAPSSESVLNLWHRSRDCSWYSACLCTFLNGLIMPLFEWLATEPSF